jgi:phosphoglycolate phosphatase
MPLLEELRKRGVKTAVVSNKADFAVKKLANGYFKGLLQEAVGENEEGGIRKKPAPDIFLKAAEKIGLDPQDCIVAEDAVAGVEAAKAAGMAAIAVTTSFSPEALADAGADRITDDLAVLPGFALEVLGDPRS